MSGFCCLTTFSLSVVTFQLVFCITPITTFLLLLNLSVSFCDISISTLIMFWDKSNTGNPHHSCKHTLGLCQLVIIICAKHFKEICDLQITESVSIFIIFRALLSKKDTTQAIAVCRILEPVNMKLAIVRNLAASWYTKQPEADISCELPAVKVRYLKCFCGY